MFNNATSFNQDLCRWNLDFSTISNFCTNSNCGSGGSCSPTIAPTIVGNVSPESNNTGHSTNNDSSYSDNGHSVICESSSISSDNVRTNTSTPCSDITRVNKAPRKSLTWADVVATNAENGSSYVHSEQP